MKPYFFPFSSCAGGYHHFNRAAQRNFLTFDQRRPAPPGRLQFGGEACHLVHTERSGDSLEAMGQTLGLLHLALCHMAHHRLYIVTVGICELVKKPRQLDLVATHNIQSPRRVESDDGLEPFFQADGGRTGVL